MKEGEHCSPSQLVSQVSIPGYAVQMARQKGLKSVCITNSGTVLPAREADVTVIIPTRSPTAVASYNLSLPLLVGVVWEAPSPVRSSLPRSPSQLFTAIWPRSSISARRQRTAYVPRRVGRSPPKDEPGPSRG